MVTKLLRINDLRWFARLPLKWLIFGLTVLAVCFPNPLLLVRHLSHWRDPNALIEPDAPALRPLVEELKSRLTDDLPPAEALKTVQDFVHEKIPYEWDWNTWGAADYMPTVTEAIEMGKEDCDGRAVVAASLLRELGYKSEIVTDLLHVWVKTDKGETMGPGDKKVAVGAEGGVRVNFAALTQLPRALAYGVAAFPFVRELIVLVVLWLLLLRRGGGVGCSLIALALLLDGLLFLRVGSVNHRFPIVWMQVLALAHGLAAFWSMLIWARQNARRRGVRAEVAPSART